MTGWPALASTAIAPQLRAWRGQAPLAEVFWVHGVLHSLTLALLLLLLVAYTAFAVVAIWRCPERQKAGGDWSLIAQALSIAWMVNVLLLTGAAALSLLV